MNAFVFLMVAGLTQPTIFDNIVWGTVSNNIACIWVRMRVVLCRCCSVSPKLKVKAKLTSKSKPEVKPEVPDVKAESEAESCEYPEPEGHPRACGPEAKPEVQAKRPEVKPGVVKPLPGRPVFGGLLGVPKPKGPVVVPPPPKFSLPRNPIFKVGVVPFAFLNVGPKLAKPSQPCGPPPTHCLPAKAPAPPSAPPPTHCLPAKAPLQSYAAMLAEYDALPVKSMPKPKQPSFPPPKSLCAHLFPATQEAVPRVDTQEPATQEPATQEPATQEAEATDDDKDESKYPEAPWHKKRRLMNAGLWYPGYPM